MPFCLIGVLRMNECLSEIEEFLAEEIQDEMTIKRILIRFRERFAKGSIYVSFDYQQRNAEIKRRYNGKNTRILAREYNLSVRQISTILKDKYHAM